MNAPANSILALSGGVGGAKLALGLADELSPGQLHVLVNTGDDFEHLGLHISPDVDTLLYTLAGLANNELGWGQANETWNTMEALGRLGGETWFRLGDKDMATHLWRTQQLKTGKGLAEIINDQAKQLGVSSHVHPMTEDAVHTTVHCIAEKLPFQHYFVKEQCMPAVTGFSFEGISAARPNRNAMRLLHDNSFSSVMICPSNPYVSVDPILQVPGLWLALRDNPAPVVLVCPIVAGLAIKGPTAKMMAELGVPVTALGVAQHYCARYPGLLDFFIIDDSDAGLAAEITKLGVEVAVTSTVMKSREDKQKLARFALQVGGR
ncbi:MAG: 2-phospho-L-lactate transferase [Halioglobus sp.]